MLTINSFRPCDQKLDSSAESSFSADRLVQLRKPRRVAELGHAAGIGGLVGLPARISLRAEATSS